MIAIDANVLLSVYNTEAREHERARAWLEATFSSVPLVGLPLVSVLAFSRISTDRRLSDAALTAEQAAEIVGTWLQRDNVSILEPGARYWPIFFDTLIDAGATVPRTTAVHLAALAIEHGATLCTNDRDFRAFTQLALEFPVRTLVARPEDANASSA
jgi:toxin-antitoxin system PIN domain toxin